MYWYFIIIPVLVIIPIYSNCTLKKFIVITIQESIAVILPVMVFGYIGGRIDCILQNEVLTSKNITTLQEFIISFFKNGGYKNPMSFLFATLSLFTLTRDFFSSRQRYLLALDKFVCFASLLFFIGNIGCFVDGHSGCRGIETNLPWGCFYNFTANKSSIPLHPAQLYYVLFFLLLFVITAIIKPIEDGKLFCITLVTTNLFFYLMDFIKQRIEIISSISYSQIIYLLNSIVVMAFYLKINRKHKLNSYHL